MKPVAVGILAGAAIALLMGATEVKPAPIAKTTPVYVVDPEGNLGADTAEVSGHPAVLFCVGAWPIRDLICYEAYDLAADSRTLLIRAFPYTVPPEAIET